MSASAAVHDEPRAGGRDHRLSASRYQWVRPVTEYEREQALRAEGVVLQQAADPPCASRRVKPGPAPPGPPQPAASGPVPGSRRSARPRPQVRAGPAPPRPRPAPRRQARSSRPPPCHRGPAAAGHPGRQQRAAGPPPTARPPRRSRARPGCSGEPYAETVPSGAARSSAGQRRQRRRHPAARSVRRRSRGSWRLRGVRRPPPSRRRARTPARRRHSAPSARRLPQAEPQDASSQSAVRAGTSAASAAGKAGVPPSRTQCT